ncbi:MAG: hypothetical protein M5U17_06125 [Ignavibacterium sp.]|nr:hypothetical protein [Ignavibacterium sp.]
MSALVNAQIKIKERVEINPESIIIPDAPLSNHTIRVDIQWSPSSLPGWILYYDLYCDQNNYSSTVSTSGTNTYSLTSPGYENYQIQFRFGSLDPNQPPITGTYQLYYDEQLIRSASFQAQPASYSNFAYFNTHYQSPVQTDYTFLINTSEICPGRYEDIYLTTSRNCNATAEINTEQDSITLTIETGKEFVSFYKNNQKKDTVTFMYHELGSVYLRQDSLYAGTTPINVNIKSDWTAILKYQQLVINPQEQFQIRVPDQPRIVFSGGVGGLKIEPHSSNICPPYISENLRYTALIKKGSNRGLLYDYDTGQSGDTLTNLTPQEDGEKYLDFITEGEIQNEEDTVLIKIFSNNENIDTTEAVIIIYPNNIVVQIIPPVIQQGDTARVVLKKRVQNGLEDFASDKLFNVEILQGLEYGLILDSLSNDTLTTFSNILQGFKIIAKDSTGIDSTKIRIKVSTEESGFPVARMIRNNTKTSKNKVVDDKENRKSDDEIITPDWIIPGPILLEGYGDVVVKEDGCDEEIVVCDSFEPQKFDDPGVGKIEKLISNAPWSWIDPVTKTPKNTDAGEGCSEGDSKTDVGLTYLMDEIGTYSHSTPTIVYKLSEDIVVEACLDERDPNDSKWRFKVKNVRVPIFADICSSVISNNNFIDLKDGNDLTLLSSNINNCLDLKRVLSDIDWMINSPYAHPCEVHPVKYLFSSGIRAHEEKHYNDIVQEVKEELKDFAFPELSKTYLSKESYPCPENSLSQLDNSGMSKTQQIKEYIFASFITQGSNIKVQKGLEFVSCLSAFPFPIFLQFKSELDADKEAQQTYRVIRSRILSWAKIQSWYDPTKTNCLGIN